MVNDIKGFGSGQTNELRNRGAAQNEAVAKRTQLNTSSAPTPAKTTEDVVNISPQASTLKSLESKIGKQPDINQERVANIRKAIAEGRYPVDAEKLAQKLLEMDDLLGS